MFFFFLSESGAYSQRRGLKFFVPYGPMLTKTKKNRKQNLKNLKYFEKPNKWSGDMVDRYMSLKFGVKPLDGFREDDVYGRTDAHVMAVALLCSSTNQS